MQTVGIFSNTNTRTHSKTVHCNIFKNCNSFFFYQQNISGFYGSKKPFISEFFWKMMSFLKMMSSWHYHLTRIYYDTIIQKKWRTIFIMNKTVLGRNLVREQCVQLMLCKNRRNKICIQIADVSSTRRNELLDPSFPQNLNRVKLTFHLDLPLSWFWLTFWEMFVPPDLYRSRFKAVQN